MTSAKASTRHGRVLTGLACFGPQICPLQKLTAPNVGGLGGLAAIQLPRRSEGTAPTFIGDGPDCRRRCHPAAAIIAALSVHIARDGR